MRRSSRIVCFLVMATIAPSLAEARGFGGRGIGRMGGALIGAPLVGRPPIGGARFGAPRLGFPRLAIRHGVRPGVFPGATGRFGRFRPGRGGRGYGFGGYGFGGGGLGLADLGLATLPYGDGIPPVGGDGPPPEFMPAEFTPAVLPPPACPLIIAVGGGLRHPARTRIVYGRQPFCRR